MPYLGYVEAHLSFPEIKGFDEDCLFLVMPDHQYGDRVPVTIGMLHIDMMLDLATREELESLSRAWDRGFVNRQIQAKKLQIDRESQLDKIKGTVRLTRNVKLKPGQTQKVKSRSNHSLNGKRVNVILEPVEDDDGDYTVPCYNYIKQNSRSIHVGLRNLSCKTVTLKKGTVVAKLSPANEIPKMLAPKLACSQLELPSQNDKLSGKLELGLQGLFARVGSGDPVRVLRLFHNNYTGYCCIHLLCIATYNLSLPRLSANYYGLPTTVQLRAACKNRCSLVGVSRSTALRYCTVPA